MMTLWVLGFWEYVHSEISRTQALDQRVVNNSLYSGHAAEEFGLRWDRTGRGLKSEFLVGSCGV